MYHRHTLCFIFGPSFLSSVLDFTFSQNISLNFSIMYHMEMVSQSVQLLSRVQPLLPHGLQHARPPSLSISNSWSLLKLMSIELVMPSNHLILCHPILLLPSIFPSIRVFSNESALHIRWPKYWNFSFSICPSNE